MYEVRDKALVVVVATVGKRDAIWCARLREAVRNCEAYPFNSSGCGGQR